MEKQVDTAKSPNPSVVILDGAFCFQMLKPKFCKTFQEYSEQVFLPYIKQSLEKVQRLDLVFHGYNHKSLKPSTREKKGTGARRRVLPSVTVPRKWQHYLRSDDNKKELFSFLSEQVMTVAIEDSYDIVREDTPSSSLRHSYTNDTLVLCSPPATESNSLTPCSHEEADTRIIVHVADAVEKGHKSVMTRTTDCATCCRGGISRFE